MLPSDATSPGWVETVPRKKSAVAVVPNLPDVLTEVSVPPGPTVTQSPK